MKALHHLNGDPHDHRPENLIEIDMADAAPIRRRDQDDEGNRILTPEEVIAIGYACWGNRFSQGTEEMGRRLGINHRSVLRLYAGEMRANAGITQELLAEFAWHMGNSPSALCKLAREALT